MLAKEYLNCKFIDMATVSVLSNTGIEDSWNAKGNNGILLVCSNVLNTNPFMLNECFRG